MALNSADKIAMESMAPEGEKPSALHEMALFFSQAADFVSPALNNHHRRVASVSIVLARAMDMPAELQRDILLAALLHDIGALSIKERVELLRFEDRFDAPDPHLHGEIGYLLFSGFEPLSAAAGIIRNHHRWWDALENMPELPAAFRDGASIVHLADRIDVLLRGREITGEHVAMLKDAIVPQRGRMFSPRAVDAFMDIASEGSLSEDYPRAEKLIGYCRGGVGSRLTLEQTLRAAEIFCHVIDFRSRFTATHSSGVAAVAGRMVARAGYSREDQLKMMIAGNLHDLGKLAVPPEIINKPGTLSEVEARIIRLHPLVTFRALENITGFDRIREWAAYHHEKPAGGGYPFRLEGGSLSTAARIVAVSDVFVAMTEERPYRRALAAGAAASTLRVMARAGELDGDAVAMLIGDIDDIDGLRSRAQEGALDGYREFERRILDVKGGEAFPG